ncbi:MAG: YfaZ family outer membrane protein, partial [Gammaproteobacteria bacterium]
MLRKALIYLLALLPASSALSAGLDLRLSSETAEVTFLTQSATFGYGGADIGIGLFLNEKDDFLANGSILVSGSGTGDVRALHFGVGGKVYAGRLDFEPSNASGGAIAVGGNLRYVFPASNPFAILAEAFWAPSVTSFSDFEGIVEY